LKKNRLAIGILVIILAGLLVACGGEPTTAPQPNSPGASTTQGGAVPAGTEAANGTAVPSSKTAVPFFSPSVSATTPAAYVLAFDLKPNSQILEASVTTPLPQGGPDDWQVEVNSDGVTKFIRNPRDKSKAQTAEHFINPDKLNDLLQQLGKLGVLDWPDITPPEKASTGGATRSLALYLKGRPKLITDLSGNNGDGLSKMLDLIKQTAEAAPLRNSP
jgi:hypothetical protein